MFYNVECLLSGAWGESARPTGVFFFGGGVRFAVSWRRITPDAFVWRALAHARVGEVERVHFAMEFVGHAVLVAIDDEAGARRRAILRRT